MKSFYLSSQCSHLTTKSFDNFPPDGGCSEGLDAFGFFLKCTGGYDVELKQRENAFDNAQKRELVENISSKQDQVRKIIKNRWLAQLHFDAPSTP